MIGWIFRMAWRDSRRQRARLLLYGSSMVLGVAALAALASFRQNMESAIDEQSKSLVGADLVLNSAEPFDAEQEDLIRSVGGEQARETRYSSMIYFEPGGQSRLVQARVVSGDFPFYGRFETTPPAAEGRFAAAEGALVEQSVLLQYGANPGGAIRVGDIKTSIAGGLDKVPGENPVFSMVAPRVYVRQPKGSKDWLLKRGSLANYRVYFRFPPGRDVEDQVRKMDPEFQRLRLGVETVARRKQQLGRAFEGLDRFLNLIALVALALGGLGVSSALSVHLREKKTTAAVLRCLGCSFPNVLGIYLIQSLALGAAGVAGGVTLGVAVQALIPRILSDFMPLQARFSIEWAALAEAAGYGMAIAAVFGILPLLEIRRATPLGAIRLAFETARERGVDGARILVWLVIGATLALFCVRHTPRRVGGIGMAAGFLAVLGSLTLIARAMVWLARRLNLARLPFVVRQGMANLHRPRNRTLLLTVILGTGAVLLLTVHLVQSALLHEFGANGTSSRGNTVLLDVQPDQVAGVEKLLQTNGLPVIDRAPIITMRLVSIKGVPIEKIGADKPHRGRRWALRREYRSSVAAGLRAGETLVAGHWPVAWRTNDALIPVSLEEGIARELEVHLGDSVVFDVQGVPVATKVAAIRQVEWKRVQANFFVIFPPGPLDDAPAFNVVVTRSESAAQSADLQKAVVRQFPNVSIIDMSAMMKTVESIISKAEAVVRFMSAFTLLTGLIVMAGALATSRTQRVRESVLLRTLGASKRQLLQILAVEYAALGVLAGLTGTILSVGTAWALCHYLLKIPFTPGLALLPVVWLLIAALSVITGLLGAGKTLDHPPLEVLRGEG